MVNPTLWRASRIREHASYDPQMSERIWECHRCTWEWNPSDMHPEWCQWYVESELGCFSGQKAFEDTPRSHLWLWTQWVSDFIWLNQFGYNHDCNQMLRVGKNWLMHGKWSHDEAKHICLVLFLNWLLINQCRICLILFSNWLLINQCRILASLSGWQLWWRKWLWRRVE